MNIKDIKKEELEKILDFYNGINEYGYIYHFSLESDNPSSQYPVYSNGIRSECMSHEFALKSKLITK